MAGTKVAVAVHPLKGMEGVVERGVSGDACHGKIKEVFSRGIATKKLFEKLVIRFDMWNLDQVGMITYHDGCSSASQTVNVG